MHYWKLQPTIALRLEDIEINTKTLIGRGAYGMVCRASHSKRGLMAVKIVPSDPSSSSIGLSFARNQHSQTTEPCSSALANWQQRTRAICGTWAFTATETFGNYGRVTPKADLWSLFVTILDVIAETGLSALAVS
jgi:serine/threonine protein kinase